jgi:hypothetical protein
MLFMRKALVPSRSSKAPTASTLRPRVRTRILVKNLRITPMNAEFAKRDVMRAYLGNDESSPRACTSRWSSRSRRRDPARRARRRSGDACTARAALRDAHRGRRGGHGAGGHDAHDHARGGRVGGRRLLQRHAALDHGRRERRLRERDHGLQRHDEGGHAGRRRGGGVRRHERLRDPRERRVQADLVGLRVGLDRLQLRRRAAQAAGLPWLGEAGAQRQGHPALEVHAAWASTKRRRHGAGGAGLLGFKVPVVANSANTPVFYLHDVLPVVQSFDSTSRTSRSSAR